MEKSVISTLAEKHGMEKAQFVQALKKTVTPTNITDAEFAAFCMVANEYGLNPLTKEIYAVPMRGSVQPVVSVDGWCNIINKNPDFNGMAFDDVLDDGDRKSVV